MTYNPVLAAAAERGVVFPGAVDFIKPEWKANYQLALDQNPDIAGMAMDAQPGMITSPNSAVPAVMTTYVDPEILRIYQAKNKAVEIFDEVRKGDWTTNTAIFPIVENTGEVSAYGDFNENGRAGANMDFPERQPFLFQVMIEWGELELARAGQAKIGWAAELQRSRVTALNKYMNYIYFYGVAGLKNYGILNAPGLPAPIAPGIKAAGGVQWFNGAAPNATANEVYNDIVSLYTNLVIQSSGNISGEITDESPLTLSLSPKSSVALTFTNNFNVNVRALLKENYPNLKIVTAVQYGAQSAQNPQGNSAGEFVQLIATSVEGQRTGECIYNEKLRSHPVIRAASSFKQKMTAGAFGALVRQPFAVASMIGV